MGVVFVGSNCLTTADAGVRSLYRRWAMFRSLSSRATIITAAVATAALMAGFTTAGGAAAGTVAAGARQRTNAACWPACAPAFWAITPAPGSTRGSSLSHGSGR